VRDSYLPRVGDEVDEQDAANLLLSVTPKPAKGNLK